MLKISNATSANIEQILDLVNQEFILSRGKTLHIKNRYPYLFDEHNFKNIFILQNEAESLLAVIVIKTVDLMLDGKLLRSFFFGSHVTPSLYRRLGYGRYLLKYVSDHYLSNGFDCGVGWTRLQDHYSKSGWVAFENGSYLEAELFKPEFYHQVGIEIYKSNLDSFQEVEEYRLRNTKDYIMRMKASPSQGYGTIYSPGEEYFCLLAKSNSSIIGYIYGVKFGRSAFIYEYKVDDFGILMGLLEYLNRDIDNFNINFSDKNDDLKKISGLFEKTTIVKPLLSIYKYYDESVANSIKNFYIPFTDRI